MHVTISDAGYLMSILAMYADWDETHDKYLISFDSLIAAIDDMIQHKNSEEEVDGA